MTKYRDLLARAVMALAVGVSGCSGADEQLAEPEGMLQQRFSTFPGEPNHEEITRLGLSFLRSDILTALQEANVATDIEFLTVNANHFDDCNFTGGSAVIQNSQAEAVAQLNPATATPESDLLVIRAFARSLHAVQDFYAHSNWIELGGEALVDRSLGAFPTLSPYSTVATSGFVIVQGAKPKRAALTRNDHARYPANAVVTLKLDKNRALGLISGTVDYEPGDFCPASVAMTHDELNKDKSTVRGRAKQFEAAKTLAILQTEHEWCRVRELTRSAWGEPGVARLETWIAAGASAPVCE